jgi:RimJ/RimL family protein N-acetyltransferase
VGDPNRRDVTHAGGGTGDGLRPALSDNDAVAPLSVGTLTGRHVVLEPLAVEHAPALAAAGAGDRASFRFTYVPDGDSEATAYVESLLADRADGRIAPFVQRRAGDGLVVGCTRFMNPAWPLGRPDPDEVEIGGTWLSADVQRTAVNSEAKLLLLSHAFDGWGVQRVAICTDARNERSRRAIERLGAICEGVLRRHRVSYVAADGTRLRDSAMYAITIDEWPDVADRLRAMT